MTTPPPPIVPAPPPVATAPPGPLPAGPSAAVKAAPAKTPAPRVVRQFVHAHPGPAVAGAAGALTLTAAAGALVAGPVAAVAAPVLLAGGSAYGYRRWQRDPAKPPAGRAGARNAGGSRPSLRERIAARRGAQSPAGPATGAPRPGRFGGFPALGRRSPGGGSGRPRGGLLGRLRGATGGRSAGSGSSVGSGSERSLAGTGRAPGSPAGPTGRRGGGGLARLLPGPAGRRARAARAAAPASPAGSATRSRGGLFRRTATPGAQAGTTVRPTTGQGAGQRTQPGRARAGLGRLWDHRPGRASRAAYAAKVNRNPRNPAGTTPAAATPNRRGLLARMRRTAPGAPPTKAAPPPSTAIPRAGGATATSTVRRRPAGSGPAKPAGPTAAMPGRRVWSSNPRHRRSPGLPVAPGDRAHTSLKTGKPVGWLSRKLGLRRTGTTLHGHIEPPNTGGVGPGPKPKPTRPDRGPGGPAWPTAGQPASTGARLAGARNARERMPEPAGAGPAAKLPAGPTAAAKPPAADNPAPRPPAGNSRRRDLGDSQWGPEPAPPAARDHRPRSSTSNGGTTVSEPSGAYGSSNMHTDADRHARTINRGGGTGEIQDMRTDMPRYEAAAVQDAEDLASRMRRCADEVSDGTPSSQAVKDAWLAIAAQQSAVAQSAADLGGMSQRVDALGHDAGERYGNDPNFGKWGGR